jgi:hypothetical protein
LAVGALQVYCALNLQLTPWKGGGFGMFSTSDSPRNRFIALSGKDSNGTIVRLSYQGNLAQALNLQPEVMDRARAMPLNIWLTMIASQALAADLTVDVTARSFGTGSGPQRYRGLLAKLTSDSPALMVARSPQLG